MHLSINDRFQVIHKAFYAHIKVFKSKLIENKVIQKSSAATFNIQRLADEENLRIFETKILNEKYTVMTTEASLEEATEWSTL